LEGVGEEGVAGVSNIFAPGIFCLLCEAFFFFFFFSFLFNFFFPFSFLPFSSSFLFI